MNYFALIVGLLLSASMGASGIAPAFCTTCGTGFIKKNYAVLLYTIFVLLGAMTLGPRVVKTISSGITSPQYLREGNILSVVITSAALSLWVSNAIGVPQSTSWVVVFSLLAVGLKFQYLNFQRILFMFSMWLILPLCAYFSSIALHKIIYPPRPWNLKIYEKIFVNEKKLKIFTLLIGCYTAFAIGTNNVANVAGPFSAAGFFKDNYISSIVVASLLFGVGAYIWGTKNLNTMGNKIAPLGSATAMIVSFITASFIVIASYLGIPQSLVQLSAASIFSLSHVKNGFSHTARSYHTHKTFLVWLISPALSFALTLLGIEIDLRFLR